MANSTYRPKAIAFLLQGFVVEFNVCYYSMSAGASKCITH